MVSKIKERIMLMVGVLSEREIVILTDDKFVFVFGKADASSVKVVYELFACIIDNDDC